jgi:hypothetical protein
VVGAGLLSMGSSRSWKVGLLEEDEVEVEFKVEVPVISDEQLIRECPANPLEGSLNLEWSFPSNRIRSKRTPEYIRR